MKECIKYLLIALIGILLCSSAVQAAGVSCTSADNDAERYVLSQAPTTHQQIIRNIFQHLSTLSLYMDSVDTTQVPGNKSVLLLLSYFRMYWLAGSPTSDSSLHASFHPVPDPHSYYVFGLRKIII